MLNVGILLFPDVEELDFIGPFEVFGMAAHCGADCRTFLIAEERQPIRCRHGLRVLPDCTLSDSPDLDLLVVPGGLGARTHARNNDRILQFVRAQEGFLASVCTGALILSSAGVLDGLVATTHHASIDLLRENKSMTVQEGIRFVIGKRVATSGGVSAGIDLSLALVARTWGEEVAAKVAENLEWHSTEWLS